MRKKKRVAEKEDGQKSGERRMPHHQMGGCQRESEEKKAPGDKEGGDIKGRL